MDVSKGYTNFQKIARHDSCTLQDLPDHQHIQFCRNFRAPVQQVVQILSDSMGHLHLIMVNPYVNQSIYMYGSKIMDYCILAYDSVHDILT